MSQYPQLLIVDDQADNIQVLGEFLDDDHEIQYALSGQEALALLGESLPDLILLDVMMPDMDGYAVCQQLKGDPRTRDIPVVFVTARNDVDSESRALAAGAVDFIHKPVNRAIVRARVQLHLTLKSRDKELRQLNAELSARVTERTQALRDALVREESAHRAKTLFLANVNHELRTPMNAILGFAGLLAGEVNDPRVRARVSRIEKAGQQLLGIVDEIIDMADLQAGKVQIQPAPFELSAVLDKAESLWRARAEEKGLGWLRESDPSLPPIVCGDSSRLEQLLGNLLSNAVKFSEQGTCTLRVRLGESTPDGVVVRFEIDDQGIGIGAERQADIFKAFEQADNSRSRRFGGAGLGLAICRQLVELMGGTIGFRSTLGRGSRFWVAIPFGCSDATAMAGLATSVPAPPPTVELDFFQLLQIFTPLTHQLAAEDVQAYLTWQHGREVLDAVLGDHAEDFATAMKALDFPHALRYLRAARNAYPELASSDIDSAR